MNMTPEVKRLHSPDVAELSAYVPADPGNFAFLLQVMVGPVGQDAEESFDVVVCTPRWISSHLGPEEILVGLHHLVVATYDYGRLERFLRRRVSECGGTTWNEIGARIGRLGRWEFDDYKPWGGEARPVPIE